MKIIKNNQKPIQKNWRRKVQSQKHNVKMTENKGNNMVQMKYHLSCNCIQSYN